ncbi:hypothetical protein VTK26DRAFT_7564 [Humicola hyalothermophila]
MACKMTLGKKTQRNSPTCCPSTAKIRTRRLLGLSTQFRGYHACCAHNQPCQIPTLGELIPFLLLLLFSHPHPFPHQPARLQPPAPFPQTQVCFSPSSSLLQATCRSLAALALASLILLVAAAALALATAILLVLLGRDGRPLGEAVLLYAGSGRGHGVSKRGR